MSFVSFFNIWVSYGLQEFVTDYGTRKSVSLQQRNQYQDNAYKDYVNRVAEETISIDKEVMPVLDNDTGRALDNFIGLYQQTLKEKFGTERLTNDELESERISYTRDKEGDTLN